MKKPYVQVPLVLLAIALTLVSCGPAESGRNAPSVIADSPAVLTPEPQDSETPQGGVTDPGIPAPSGSMMNPAPTAPYYVYKDSDYPENHYTPSGYMGDTDDVSMDEACDTKPFSGLTCIRVAYTPNGNNKWAGVYWLHPANFWGEEPLPAGETLYNLTGYNKLLFCARAEKACTAEFLAGGVDKPYGDSLKEKRKITVKLSADWKEYTIDLKGADLSAIVGGFGFSTARTANPKGAVFFLDEVRYVKS
jgi:hypothetical protein